MCKALLLPAGLIPAPKVVGAKNFFFSVDNCGGTFSYSVRTSPFVFRPCRGASVAERRTGKINSLASWKALGDRALTPATWETSITTAWLRAFRALIFFLLLDWAKSCSQQIRVIDGALYETVAARSSDTHMSVR